MSEHLPRFLLKLCRYHSIQREFWDLFGNRRVASQETLEKVLRSLGADPSSAESAEAYLLARQEREHQRLMAPVFVRHLGSSISITLSVPGGDSAQLINWELSLESGEIESGDASLAGCRFIRERKFPGKVYRLYKFNFPLDVGAGYHRLRLRIGEFLAESSLIMAPVRCAQLEDVIEGRHKVWGLSAQLYAIRSEKNWGIGQFTDLIPLISEVGKRGGAFLGLNPVNALSTYLGDQNSPYSATSRYFLNPFCLDCEAIPEVGESKEAQALIESSSFQARIKGIRAAEQVDYAEVRALKSEVFKLAFRHFESEHLKRSSERAANFLKFVEEQGERLEIYALYEALGEYFFKEDSSQWGWPAWPEGFRHPEDREVQKFRQTQRSRIYYFQYLQWNSYQQFELVNQHCLKAGLDLGLYLDFALSADRGGSEVWRDQELFAHDMSVGSPPDDYNYKGQDWGFAPSLPDLLKEAGYEPFVAALRAAMREAGAIRIDHAMSLMRLYWIPQGSSAEHGAYVRYPYRDLMSIVSLESSRNNCVVICEDLGTVAPSFREEMGRHGMLSYKVLFFSKTGPTDFADSGSYPVKALATGTTHDMHTVWGFWRALDFELRHRLGLWPDKSLGELQDFRAAEKRNLLELLVREGLLPGDGDRGAWMHELSDEIFAAMQRFLAKTSCELMVVPIEDLAGQIEQVNMPGITSEYPSWKIKLPVSLEQISELARFEDLANYLKNEGRSLR